jgi:hypothetical protein
VAVLALVASIARADAAPPSNVGQVEFFVVCPYSHSRTADPILFPAPGTNMSHMHAFLGNTTTSPASTSTSLRAGATCRSTSDDRSAYWVPQPYLDGKPLNPDHISAYYSNWPKQGTVDSPSVSAFPADAQLIGGDARATAPLPTWKVRWSCGNANGVTAPAASKPYNCSSQFGASKGFDGLVASIFMPACWNGVSPARTNGPGATVVYYDAVTGQCPAGYGVKLVRLSVRVHFGVFDVVRPDGSIRLTFAGMDMLTDGSMRFVATHPYWTLHADFMNGWNQTRLAGLVATCLNAGGDQDCSNRLS